MAGFDASATGFRFGGVAGVDFQAGQQVGIETGVSFDFVRLGDQTIDGVEIPESDSSGGALGVFVGILIFFSR